MTGGSITGSETEVSHIAGRPFAWLVVLGLVMGVVLAGTVSVPPAAAQEADVEAQVTQTLTELADSWRNFDIETFASRFTCEALAEDFAFLEVTCENTGPLGAIMGSVTSFEVVEMVSSTETTATAVVVRTADGEATPAEEWDFILEDGVWKVSGSRELAEAEPEASEPEASEPAMTPPTTGDGGLMGSGSSSSATTYLVPSLILALGAALGLSLLRRRTSDQEPLG